MFTGDSLQLPDLMNDASQQKLSEVLCKALEKEMSDDIDVPEITCSIDTQSMVTDNMMETAFHVTYYYNCPLDPNLTCSFTTNGSATDYITEFCADEENMAKLMRDMTKKAKTGKKSLKGLTDLSEELAVQADLRVCPTILNDEDACKANEACKWKKGSNFCLPADSKASKRRRLRVYADAW